MRRYKTGRYVKTNKGIGIISNISHKHIEVHYLNECGETTDIVNHLPEEVEVVKKDHVVSARIAMHKIDFGRGAII
jgi:hypothetical protein